MSYRIEESPD